MPFFRKYTLENAPMPPTSRIDLDIIPDKCTSIFSSSWCNEICFQDWPLSLSHDQYLSVKWQKKNNILVYLSNIASSDMLINVYVFAAVAEDF